MISIILPFRNEKGNLAKVSEELDIVLKKISEPSEVIWVNDYSTDGGEKSVAGVSNTGQSGKGAALALGTVKAKGDIIVCLDADGQDSPAEIPMFLAKIRQGYDLVNGARTSRTHTTSIRMLASIYNRALQKFFDSPFSDIGCGFKAFKRSILEEIPLNQASYRLFPLYVAKSGYRVDEVVVENRTRVHGVSKFGVGKWLSGIREIARFYHWLKSR